MQSFWPRGLWPNGLWPSELWPAPPVSPSPVPTFQTHLTAQTFPFRRNFPGLYDVNGYAPEVDNAILIVETEWSGIFEMFSTLDMQTMINRQAILDSYLVGWWLGDMFPGKMRGVQGDGGMPLVSKSIGGVSVTRKEIEMQPALAPLLSNTFGVKAAMMLMSRVERFALLPQAPAAPVPVLTWQQFALAVLQGGVPSP